MRPDWSCNVAKLALPITRLSIMRPATRATVPSVSSCSAALWPWPACSCPAWSPGLKSLGKAGPAPPFWASRKALSFSRRSATSWFSSVGGVVCSWDMGRARVRCGESGTLHCRFGEGARPCTPIIAAMFLKAGALSLALLLASRLLGLARESAQAAAFGASGMGDVAVLMLTLPDWLAGVLASGALAFVLLPLWAHEEGARIAATQRRVGRGLLAGGVLLALLLVLAQEPAVHWLAG